MSKDKKKLTIKELELILRQPDCRLRKVILPNGEIDAVPTECGEEVNLLKKLYEACLQAGQSRKHDCCGFDCATCNTTPMFDALNNLEEYYSPDPPSGTVMPNGTEI